jgi:cell division protein FtsI (penicillin-binding protein 3)
MSVSRLEGQRPAARGGGNMTRGRRMLQRSEVPAGRLLTVYLLLATGLCGLALRLAWVQLVQGPDLRSRARSVQTQTIKPLGRRRTIVDRQGGVVALDEDRYTLWAHPRYFAFPGDDINHLRSPLDVARKLSGVLSMPMAELVRALEGHKSGVKLSTDLDPETAQRVRALGISGIDLEPYPQRVYPQGPLFANVVGFLNLERTPQAGLEQSRNSDLQRQEQTRHLRRGADGTPLPDGLKAGSIYGDDLRLQLTLDARLQQVAQMALVEQVKKWKAKRGAGDGRAQRRNAGDGLHPHLRPQCVLGLQTWSIPGVVGSRSL